MTIHDLVDLSVISIPADFVAERIAGAPGLRGVIALRHDFAITDFCDLVLDTDIPVVHGKTKAISPARIYAETDSPGVCGFLEHVRVTRGRTIAGVFIREDRLLSCVREILEG